MTFAEVYQHNKQAGNVRSYRHLAGEISAALSPHDKISYAAIALWMRGTRPNYWMVLYLYQHSAGWLHDMAAALLADQRPEVWGKNGLEENCATENAG